MHRDAVGIHVAKALVLEIEQLPQQSQWGVTRLRIVDSLHENQVKAVAGSARDALQAGGNFGNRKSFFRCDAADPLQIGRHCWRFASEKFGNETSGEERAASQYGTLQHGAAVYGEIR